MPYNYNRPASYFRQAAVWSRRRRLARKAAIRWVRPRYTASLGNRRALVTYQSRYGRYRRLRRRYGRR